MTETIIRIIKKEEDLKRAEVGEMVLFSDNFYGVYAGNVNGEREVYGKKIVPLFIKKRKGDCLEGSLMYSGEYTLFVDWRFSKEKDPTKFNMYNAILEAGK